MPLDTCISRSILAPYNAGRSGKRVGDIYSFLMELTTAWVKGEHSVDGLETFIVEYRRTAVRTKFIERVVEEIL
jgi:hypothetical protein